MKYTSIIITALLSFALLSCEEDKEQRLAETLRLEQRNDSIVKVIDNHWRFDVPVPKDKVQKNLDDWNEWRQFKSELMQKPTGTLTAYEQKVETLISKLSSVKTTIIPFFNKPEVVTRLMVLDTKIKSLHTYISLDAVQSDKVLVLIDEVTKETISLQNQFEEIVRKSEIPKEVGEEEMLRALDTSRMANPDMVPDVLNPTPATPKLAVPTTEGND
ncbi:MAG: hypothetical protein BM557_06105 [Flavobacterium sp. MedPE-SWcel]|uniref:hypothetical protein n=1 Tax=uncultured Flavobacterium sp. TaxID=165435 RepID=UPI000922C746|nr:hypothetical protein [uncultured Flavobacterium sp.]OIQ19274.1 MAG: hypothetical protein BM557_06105 [Flavobacterium sp. MedPE-SWcel]